MNAYIYHMLLRARELDGEDFEVQGRDTPRQDKCPFCVADEDQTWAVVDRKPWKLSAAPPPFCEYCPLKSVTDIPMEELMNDCYKIGKSLLKTYEERGDDV